MAGNKVDKTKIKVKINIGDKRELARAMGIVHFLLGAVIGHSLRVSITWYKAFVKERAILYFECIAVSSSGQV